MDRQGALAWLEAHGRAVPVFLEDEIPPDVLQTLRRLDLTIYVPGGVIVVRSPGDDRDLVVRSLLWPIVERITSRYAPAVVERDSAVRLLLGRTDPGPEIRIRQTGKTRWREEILPGVAVRVESGDVSAVQRVDVGEASIPVDSPEGVLLTLPVQFLRDGGIEDVAIWMRSLTLARPALVAAYQRNPRPVVLKRLEHIARDVGNERLANMIEGVLAEEQSVRIGRDRTDVGRGLVIPHVVVSARTSHRPWLDRLRIAIRRSRDAAAKVIEERGSPEPDADLAGLLQRAAQAKAYDAYHSSSIEGYRLSLDDVSVLLGGGAGGGRDIEDVRSKLAVMGYGIAFDRLLRRIRDAGGEVPLTNELALDLYTDLFAPSIEAGLIPANDLRGWRTGPVFIRDTLYVPPGAAKVPAMLDLLFEELGEVGYAQGMLRGILVHLWFVWVHPVPDGNGRTARFLMNTAFFGGGLPWLTIRVEQRAEYFAMLRLAQLNEDFAPFARFILRSATPG
jgi:hypothetical protein